MKKQANNKKIDFAIKNYKTLTLSTFTYLPHERNYIDHVLCRYLQEVGLDSIKDKLCYCIHEIAGNAKKANTKRVYFDELGLDINNPEDYFRGMKNFKDDTTENIGHYLKKQREAGLYIRFYFKREPSNLRIIIRNNVALLPEESLRIQQKLKIARTYNNLAEAYTESEDYSEGAGLGIVMLLLMLKNLGFSKNSLEIFMEEDCTNTVLTLDLISYSPSVDFQESFTA